MKKVETKTLFGRDGSSVRVPVDPKPKNKKKRPRHVDIQRRGSNLKKVKHKLAKLERKQAKAERRKEALSKSIAADEKLLETIDWSKIDPDEPIPFTITDKGRQTLEELRQAHDCDGQEPIITEGQHRVINKI